MGKKLVIVESPGKIAKIQSILGKDYIVMASVGHIIELDKKYMVVNENLNKFEPQYVISNDKKSVVKKIKDVQKNVDEVLLAADKDREGEMIAWSLAKELHLKNPKRIVFNAITKDDLLNAINAPCLIDQNLVDAQISRSLMDIIIGYELSPLLWKHIGGKLSAGRVQSVVVKLIIDKENEIKKFFEAESAYHFKTTGLLSYGNNKLNVILQEKEKTKVIVTEDIEKIIKKIIKSKFKLESVTEKDKIQNAPQPFTTSTLQQEASHKCGYSSKTTMNIAQKLYEAGHITYMRTDSINLSKEALDDIHDYIIEKYGEKYYKKTIFVTKSKNTQEAHEAIRPSHMNIIASSLVNVSDYERKLYDLIWKRTIASQMSSAKFKITNMIISISDVNTHYFLAQYEVNIFKGYLKIYGKIENSGEKEDEIQITNDNIEIPKVGTEFTIQNINSVQTYKTPPSRFNEASLINKMDPKNLNIGRPSTYSSIIAKIQSTGYIKEQDNEGIDKDCIVLNWVQDEYNNKLQKTTHSVKLGYDKKKFTPTEIGIKVTKFLENNFGNIIDYDFTAKMENQLDEVAKGEITKDNALENFYNPFIKNVNKLNKDEPEKNKNITKTLLGVHPNTKQNIYIVDLYYGPAVMLEDDTKKKQHTVSIRPPLTKKNISINDAVKLLNFPKLLGKYQRKNIEMCNGPHGIYIKWGDEKINVEISEDKINNYSLEDAIILLNKTEEDILWKKIDGSIIYIIKEGPHGKYISVKEKNKKSITRSIKDNEYTAEITLEQVKEILKKPKKKFVKRNYKK
jgi:DNA topoisomerase I